MRFRKGVCGENQRLRWAAEALLEGLCVAPNVRVNNLLGGWESSLAVKDMLVKVWVSGWASADVTDVA